MTDSPTPTHDEQPPPPVDEGGSEEFKLRSWHTYASLALTLAIMVVLANMVDLDAVWENVKACNKGWVITGLLAHYATYPVRGLRWQRCMTRMDVEHGATRFGLIVFFYNFVDNLVPAKLGDVYGAHLAKLNLGVRRSVALGSIIFQRMIDSWVVLVFAAGSSWLLFSGKLPTPVFWVLIGGLALAVIVTMITLAFVIFKETVPSWVPSFISERMRSFHFGMLPARSQTLSISFLTVLIWSLETAWIMALLRAFDVQVGLVEVVFLTMVPLLASAFPLTPSGAGAVELTLYGSLTVVGVAGPLAASITVVNRFIDYWLHIALGLLVWGLRAHVGLGTWRTEKAKMSEIDGT